jgi:hypothetical protein
MILLPPNLANNMKIDMVGFPAPSVTMRRAHWSLLIVALLSVSSLLAQDTAAPPKSDATSKQDATAKQPGPAPPPVSANAPGATGAYWTAFWVCTGLLLVAALAMTTALKRDPNWSLAAALSEESSPIVPPEPPVGAGAMAVQAPAPPVVIALGAPAPGAAASPPLAPVIAPAPVPEPRLVGSASRLIAAFGLMVLAVMILGIGYGIMWNLFTAGKIPNLNGIGPYLLGGSALFAPYAFNQIKEAFKP